MKKDILIGAIITSIVGALIFILSNNPDGDSVGWVTFILGAIVAVVMALIIALTSRGSSL